MKSILGLLTLLIGLTSYGLYIRNILRGYTKPHMLSWLIWSLLAAVVFLAQVDGGAGAGSWITGLTAVAAFIIFVLALRYGRSANSFFDWLCLAAAVAAIAIYLGHAGPWLAVVIASSVFVLGLIPTLVKAYRRPREETAMTFWLNGLKFLLAIAALESLSLLTVLYPLTLVIFNWLLVGVILWRRSTGKHK
jgi:hypothetical protein